MMTVSDMTTEQLAGQRLMGGFYGTELNSDLEFLIKHLHIGGIILFRRNLTGPEQIRSLCLSVQEFAASCGTPPLFIAIDQEGGQVARLKEPFTVFPGNPFIKECDDAVRFASVTAAELKSVGVSMNLAPVMDVAPEGVSGIMSGRAFGTDPRRVAELGAVVIETLQKNGISAVAKHFPGIGRTVDDSHIDLPSLKDVSVSDLESSDLIPFYAAIRSGVAGIMLSHIRYDDIDPEFPASLSVRIAKELLRDRMGYQGIVITDDLEMGAVKKYFDIRTMISRILPADVDIALICHTRSDIETAFEEIVFQYQTSAETRDRGVHSWQRIRKIKGLDNEA